MEFAAKFFIIFFVFEYLLARSDLVFFESAIASFQAGLLGLSFRGNLVFRLEAKAAVFPFSCVDGVVFGPSAYRSQPRGREHFFRTLHVRGFHRVRIYHQFACLARVAEKRILQGGCRGFPGTHHGSGLSGDPRKDIGVAG